MAKELHFVVNGLEHTLRLKGSSAVLDGKVFKFKNLQKENEAGLIRYTLPVDSDKVYIYNRLYVGASAVYNGVDIATGKEYVAAPTPKWVIVFVVLYVIDFILLLGGAIGGIVNAVGVAVSAKIALNQEKTTAKRVLLCALIWVGFTVLEFVLAGVFASAFAAMGI